MLILDFTGNYFIIISSGRSRKFRKGWPQRPWPTPKSTLDFFSMYNFVKVNLHGMTLLHVMCLPKAYNMSCLMKIKPGTYCLVTDLYTTQLVLQVSGKYIPCYKVIACKLAFSFALFSRIFTVIYLRYSYYVYHGWL